MKRSDFAERLHAAVAARRGQPFQWGENDCALFACDLVEAATGVDYAAPFRGRYRTAAGAARALKRFVAGSRRLARPAAPPGHPRDHNAGLGLVRPAKPTPDPWPGGAAGRAAGEPSSNKPLLEAAAEKITQDNGLEEVPPLMAQRGDFVLVDETAGPAPLEAALGVCLGETFVAAGPAGTVTLPLTRARRAWRV